VRRFLLPGLSTPPPLRGPSEAVEGAEEVDWGDIVPRLQAFYGGDPLAWFNAPAWALTCYLKMLPALAAEQQLRTIEAVSVPHMKQEAVGRLVGRLGRQARRERPKAVSEQLMEAMQVVYTPAPTPTKEVTDGG
jgi:hypothetical protein